MFMLINVGYKDILDIKKLEIEAGRVNCLVGESGSGKTTLLRMLNKMISPDRGDIFYNRTSLSELDSVELRRRVVMLPQAPAIFPGSIRDNLLVGLRFSERPDADDSTLLSSLETACLSKKLDDDADKLSGGEKQRLALARVLLLDPDVYLLDEPSAALDEDTERLLMERLVTQVRGRKKTLIMVTHSKQVASQFADHIIEMKNGRIIRGGETENGPNH